jgi:hypothetical protein
MRTVYIIIIVENFKSQRFMIQNHVTFDQNLGKPLAAMIDCQQDIRRIIELGFIGSYLRLGESRYVEPRSDCELLITTLFTCVTSDQVKCHDNKHS